MPVPAAHRTTAAGFAHELQPVRKETRHRQTPLRSSLVRPVAAMEVIVSPDQGTPTRVIHIRTRTLAVLAATTLLTLSMGAGVASAQGDQPLSQNTFTKWVTGPGTAPVLANMGGVVGGDVGDGTFTGEVLTKTPTDTGAVINALYHFTGSERAFTANVHVVQEGLKATITGRITDGWLHGSLVTGEYTQTTCPDSPAAEQTCFQGTLDTSDQPQTIDFWERTHATFVPLGTLNGCTNTTSCVGDIYVGEKPLFDTVTGLEIGAIAFECFFIEAGTNRVHCPGVTITLTGRGQIVFTGTEDIDNAAGERGPIIGGTGEFLGATGVVDAPALFHLVVTITE